MNAAAKDLFETARSFSRQALVSTPLLLRFARTELRADRLQAPLIATLVGIAVLTWGAVEGGSNLALTALYVIAYGSLTVGGSLAAGAALGQDRQTSVIDFVRITPTKRVPMALGYLFGAPLRATVLGLLFVLAAGVVQMLVSSPASLFEILTGIAKALGVGLLFFVHALALQSIALATTAGGSASRGRNAFSVAAALILFYLSPLGQLAGSGFLGLVAQWGTEPFATGEAQGIWKSWSPVWLANVYGTFALSMATHGVLLVFGIAVLCRRLHNDEIVLCPPWCAALTAAVFSGLCTAWAAGRGAAEIEMAIFWATLFMTLIGLMSVPTALSSRKAAAGSPHVQLVGPRWILGLLGAQVFGLACLGPSWTWHHAAYAITMGIAGLSLVALVQAFHVYPSADGSRGMKVALLVIWVIFDAVGVPLAATAGSNAVLLELATALRLASPLSAAIPPETPLPWEFQGHWFPWIAPLVSPVFWTVLFCVLMERWRRRAQAAPES